MTRSRTPLAVLVPLALALPLLPAQALAAPSTAATAVTAAAAPGTPAIGGRFHPLTPARLLDTRLTNSPVRSAADRPVVVAGVAGVPATGASAVVVNVTVTGSTGPGNLQIYPTGQRPSRRTSNLNYRAGGTVPVLVQSGVGPDGSISLSVDGGTTQVVVDVMGWYDNGNDGTGAGYQPTGPQRAFDTRDNGSPVVAGADRTVTLAGVAGVPSDATAVVLNTTVLGASAPADLQVYPAGAQPARRTSNLNVVRGQTVANAVVAALGTDGSIVLSVSQGQVSVVLDVVGYYSPQATGRFTPVTPARLLDTRLTGGPVSAGADRDLRVAGSGGVPAGASAAVLSVTGTGASNPLDLQVYPTGQRPTLRTSTLNLRPGQEVANAAVAPLGANGSTSFSVSQGRAAVVVDVLGYFVPDASPLLTLSSPNEGDSIAPGEGRVGAGSPDGTGFTLDLQVQTLDAVGVQVNEGLNIRDTSRVGQPNVNFPGLDVRVDRDLITPAGTTIAAGTNLAALFNIAGTDDTPGPGVTVWAGWHVLESLLPGTPSLTVTAKVTDEAGRTSTTVETYAVTAQRGASGQALTPPATATVTTSSDIRGPQVSFQAPDATSSIALGTLPQPTLANGTLHFIQVDALDVARHGLAVDENGAMNAGVIADPTQIGAKGSNRNAPGLDFTFDVALRQPNGNLVPAGQNLAPLFNIAGSSIAPDGSIRTSFGWVVGGSLVLPTGQRTVTMTATVTDLAGRSTSTSQTVGLSPVTSGQQLTPQP